MQPQVPIPFCRLDHHAYNLAGQCVSCGHWRDSQPVVITRCITEGDGYRLAETLREVGTAEFRRALALALSEPGPTPEEARILTLAGAA